LPGRGQPPENERDSSFSGVVGTAIAAGLSLQTCLLTIYVYISSMQKGSAVKRQVQKGRVGAKRQDECKKAKGRVGAKR
jgi:hypothetical protein